MATKPPGLLFVSNFKAGAFPLEAPQAEKEGLQTLDRAYDEGASFDTVLLDLQLPGIDGLEIARRVKASKRSRVQT